MFQIVTVCNVSPEHWVTLRICLDEWRIELYDSLWNRMDQKGRDFRVITLRPVTHLLSKLLQYAGFWIARKGDDFVPEHRCCPLYCINEWQYEQLDEINCGTYASMYVHRILTGIPTPEMIKSVEDLQRYRISMGVRIWDMCVNHH